MQRAAYALSMALLAMTAFAQTAPEPAPTAAPVVAAPAADAAPATVVVVEGRRPGPGVWKVSKGDHVMWVFGLYAPLPQKMEWDDARVERLLRQSQEVLLPAYWRIEIGFFRSLWMMPTMMSLDDAPDGVTLQQSVPADAYARWRVLKDKYMPDEEKVERKRPIFAIDHLLVAALRKSGLTLPNADVGEQILKIAKRNKIRTTETALVIAPADPGRLAKEFKQSKIDDVACFARTLDTLEQDLGAMRARANAWANGDMAAIDAANFRASDRVCYEAFLNGSLARTAPEFRDLPGQVAAKWLRTAEAALATNTTTFAMLRMDQIADKQNFLAALQAKGYTVESPAR